jgi:hypothetical protein
MANAFEAKLEDFQARLYAKSGTDVKLNLSSKNGSGLDNEKYYDWVDDVEEGLFGDEAGSVSLINICILLGHYGPHRVPLAALHRMQLACRLSQCL